MHVGICLCRINIFKEFNDDHYQRLNCRLVNVITIVIDAVDESNSDLGVIISHQHDIKQLLAVWV